MPGSITHTHKLIAIKYQQDGFFGCKINKTIWTGECMTQNLWLIKATWVDNMNELLLVYSFYEIFFCKWEMQFWEEATDVFDTILTF